MSLLKAIGRQLASIAAVLGLVFFGGAGPLSATQPTDQKPKAERKAAEPKAEAASEAGQGGTDETRANETSTAPKGKESALVRAARSGGAGSGKARVVLTNESVKNSKGKLTVISASTDPPKITLEKQESEKAGTGQQAEREVAATEKKQTSPLVSAVDSGKRLEKAKREVGELEKELDRIEQEYYAEDDPSYRDQVIRPRFERVKIQLELAREALLSAREEQNSSY